MKKFISVLIAFAMLFVLCVPCFATNPLVAEGSDSSSVIKTNTSSILSPDGYFTVTFPAETPIYWQEKGDSLTDITGCVLDSHLIAGKTLEVTVTAGTGTMTASGLATTISYTIDGESIVNKNTPVVNNLTFTPKVKILANQWSQAIVGEYSDTLTFTATVKDIVAAP